MLRWCKCDHLQRNRLPPYVVSVKAGGSSRSKCSEDLLVMNAHSAPSSSDLSLPPSSFLDASLFSPSEAELGTIVQLNPTASSSWILLSISSLVNLLWASPALYFLYMARWSLTHLPSFLSFVSTLASPCSSMYCLSSWYLSSQLSFGLAL